MALPPPPKPEPDPAAFEEDPRTNPKLHRRRALAKDRRAGDPLYKLAVLVGSGELSDALRAVALLKLRLADAEKRLIGLAHAKGWRAWAIAARMGVSDQAVHARFKRISASSSRRT